MSPRWPTPPTVAHPSPGRSGGGGETTRSSGRSAPPWEERVPGVPPSVPLSLSRGLARQAAHLSSPRSAPSGIRPDRVKGEGGIGLATFRSVPAPCGPPSGREAARRRASRAGQRTSVGRQAGSRPSLGAVPAPAPSPYGREVRKGEGARAIRGSHTHPPVSSFTFYVCPLRFAKGGALCGRRGRGGSTDGSANEDRRWSGRPVPYLRGGGGLRLLPPPPTLDPDPPPALFPRSSPSLPPTDAFPPPPYTSYPQVSAAEATTDKISSELVDLKSALVNIEQSRPIDDLLVDDVAKAIPELDDAVDTMISKGKWEVPGYKEKVSPPPPPPTIPLSPFYSDLACLRDHPTHLRRSHESGKTDFLLSALAVRQLQHDVKTAVDSSDRWFCPKGGVCVWLREGERGGTGGGEKYGGRSGCPEREGALVCPSSVSRRPL